MALLIVPFLAYGIYTMFPPSNFSERNALNYTDEAYLPERLRFPSREQSFAGQDYTTVRAPFNPGNPNWPKVVGDGDMLESKRFQESYQMNIRNNTILTEDYRLDDIFFTTKNVTGSYHFGGEGSFQKLEDYSNQKTPHQEWPPK